MRFILKTDVEYKCENNVIDTIKERFPKDFYFQLTQVEANNLWFQTETANKMSRSLPYAFTEQGVAMLSSVLRTDIAAMVSIKIMRAFVAMRKYTSNNMLEQKYINNLVLEHDENIKLLQASFDKKIKNKIIKSHYCNHNVLIL